jgi:hypothetical protein
MHFFEPENEALDGGPAFLEPVRQAVTAGAIRPAGVGQRARSVIAILPHTQIFRFNPVPKPSCLKF